ncbi:DUF1667 domain-containing protein [Collinsella sp. BA40]|uniref:DUF1667 domain-containing protein n=1 Tax=Collinsella sp. BA40 TaxID=2560852 RepID=UPI0011C90D09|nr:DUF1667 domain-containing protein [Collinsella sp. BA40]TXF37626.1 DUF1667 domain-containing protein [Collinsella sp. BA40]
MSTTERFHCTTCPSECLLAVEVERDAGTALVVDVNGNRCPRGEAFARQEITCPMRILATTVPVTGSDIELLPVRTAEAIPRALHADAMVELRRLCVDAPVRMGDIVLPNILDTGVDVVASLDADEV